jgi:hypothetical protein
MAEKNFSDAKVALKRVLVHLGHKEDESEGEANNPSP